MLWAVSMVSGGGANTWVGHHGCSPVSTAPAYGGGFTPTNTLEGASSPRKGLFRSKQGSGGMFQRCLSLCKVQATPLRQVSGSCAELQEGNSILSSARVFLRPPHVGCHSNRTIPKCNLGGWGGNLTAFPGGLQESSESMGRKLGELPSGLRESRLISPQEGPGLVASLGVRERPAGVLQQIQADFLTSSSFRGTLGSQAEWNPLTSDSVHDEMSVSLQKQEDGNLC